MIRQTLSEKILEKIAYELQEHQERVAKRIEDGESLLAVHSLGSGKTLTALEAAKRVQKRDPEGQIVAIVPAPLVSNMEKEIDKHKIGIDKKRFHVTSYEMAMKNGENIAALKPSLVIMDEAHKGRNVGAERTRFVRWLGANSKQTLMLTATPSYNKASDVAVLTNTLAKKKVLPEDPKDFESAFTYTTHRSPGFFREAFLNMDPIEETGLRNQKILQDVLGKHLDFHDAQKHNKEDFPEKVETTHDVEMSPEQEKMYKYVEGELPVHLRLKIRSGLPMSKKEIQALNSFSTGIRQVSNTLDPYLASSEAKEKSITPKLQKMVDNLHEHSKTIPNFRGVVYSNYLDAGLRPYSRELTKRGINHAIFDGSLSAKKKKELIESYNEGKLPVLLVSSSGTEGLDLKGTKVMQVMEPHFNAEKINQVIGRGIRYKSHAHLPEEERKVLVEKYRSVLPKKKFESVIEKHKGALKSFFGMDTGENDKSIDEYLNTMSHEKKDFSEQILEQGRVGFENKYLQKVAELTLSKDDVEVLRARRPVESFVRGAVPIAGAMYGLPILRGAVSGAMFKGGASAAKVLQKLTKKDLSKFISIASNTGDGFLHVAKTSLDPRKNIFVPISLGLGGLAGVAAIGLNSMDAGKREKALSSLGVNLETGGEGRLSPNLTEKSIDKHFKTLSTARADIKRPLAYRLRSMVNPPEFFMNLGTDYVDHRRNLTVDQALSNLKGNIYLRRLSKGDSGQGSQKAWNTFELQDESFYK